MNDHTSALLKQLDEQHALRAVTLSTHPKTTLYSEAAIGFVQAGEWPWEPYKKRESKALASAAAKIARTQSEGRK